MPNTLESNLARVRLAIADAARSAGRRPLDVELVAVTKTVGVDSALELLGLGQRDLGEGRVDELERKVHGVGELWRKEGPLGMNRPGPRWHFVGHVQGNKARRIVELADVIHSVDSLRLLETLDRIAEDVGRSIQVYLQVKLHSEDTKTGFDPAQVGAALAVAQASRRLSPVGLMTMAPLVEDDEVERVRLAEHVFVKLAELARELGPRPGLELGLSMGMSEDFPIAVRAGSTCVRVGSALFSGISAPQVRA